jgi:hypothetical protein
VPDPKKISDNRRSAFGTTWIFGFAAFDSSKRCLTFVLAASRLAGLRDPDRLRPWLYAVARNECYRRLRARNRTTGLQEAGEMTGRRHRAARHHQPRSRVTGRPAAYDRGGHALPAGHCPSQHTVRQHTVRQHTVRQHTVSRRTT